ncbi:hypothetical protein ACP70R_008488 [Stipagrostis hirtigluma subsp. patula]
MEGAAGTQPPTSPTPPPKLERESSKMDPAAAARASAAASAAAAVRARLVQLEADGVPPAKIAVTVATGALGPVLVKLTALLGKEFKLPWCTRRDIKFVKSKLQPVHSLLLRIWEREDVEDACKSWMNEVRNQSYAMEDAIDDFIAGLKRDDTAGCFRPATKASPFRDLKKLVRELVKQCEDRWKNLETISVRSEPVLDARARFLHKDASELVGMDTPKEKVIEELKENKMVCINGPAGVGKTTLADLVYQAIGEGFQCRAFVSLSPSPDMKEVLKSILTQVTNGVQSTGTEAATEQNLVDKISSFLADKRYLVVVDNIWHWEEWKIIGGALPENSLSSKIITTTHIKAIADKCEAIDAATYRLWCFSCDEIRTFLDLIMKKSGADGKIPETEIGSVTNSILHMCDGMPLAVVCLAKALAESVAEGTYEAWDTWIRHIRGEFLSIPSLKPLVESFCLGYNDLPVHLKTCLLYCSIYYENPHFISRASLVTKWIAEGFVYQEKAAESYYEELISATNHPVLKTNYVEVHPMMLAFLVCRSEEVNFVTCINDCNDLNLNRNAKWIQRLSIYNREDSIDFSRMGVSRTRSLAWFSGRKIVPDIKHFGRLRVLHLERNKDLENEHLAAICGLLSLRYLGIPECEKISMLPREIGRLQNLETLDVSYTEVRELPWEAAQLPNLVCVIHGWHQHRVVKLPEVLREAMKTGTDLSYQAMCPSIMLRDYFYQTTEQLPVKFGSRYVGVPPWISAAFRDVSSLDIMLCKLEEDDQKLLGGLPNLENLVVRFQLLPRKTIPIIGGGFGRLRIFCFDCRMPRLTFQPGAMPNLFWLEFKFYSGPPSKDPLNIMHLRRLADVSFKCSENYSSDAPGISATIDVVRREAAEHPNKIWLSINDNAEEFPEKENTPEIREQDSSIILGAASSSAIDAESSNGSDDNTDGNKGKTPQVSNHASSSRTNEVHEIEEAQE